MIIIIMIFNLTREEPKFLSKLPLIIYILVIYESLIYA